MSQQMRRMVPRRYYSNHYSEITFKTSFHNCVLKALQNRKWRQIETTGWNLQWSQKQRVNDVFEEGLNSTQRCNHFRLWGQLCRKDMMIKNIRKHRRQLQKEKTLVEADWDFLPLTYFLPSEYIMFAEDFRRKGGLWIMKPTSRCQGQGIFIIDKLAQVAPFRQKILPGQTSTPQNLKPVLPPHKSKKEEQKRNEKQSESQQEQEEKNDEAPPSQSYLIQQYISRPLLFGSKKFDLRIYCLCTNYSQLTAWLYRSGFARFTHQPYNPDNIGNLQSHLTNVEIQKHSQNYDERRGGKWLIDKFKHYLLSRYDPIRVDWCFTEIKNIIIRSLQSVQKSILPSKNSFQLYGYDFMIDADLKPWLIEINGGPSMTANTDFDCRLKCGLIDDVLTIIDLEGMLEGNEMAVGGFDLIIDKGIKVVQDKHSQYTCFLGARNQRVKVVRHLIRKFLMRKSNEESKENNQQKEVQVKIKKKGIEQKGKEKLLPNFYYRRRMEDINSDIRQQLQEQLEILQQNDAIESNPNAQFTPLKLLA